MVKITLRNMAMGMAATALLATVVPTTAHKKAAVTQPFTVSSRTMSHNDSLRYDYFFLEAVSQQTLGHYAAAFDLLNHCLGINPNAAEAYYFKAMYLAELDSDSAAVRMMETAARLNPDNNTYLERVAQYYTGTGKYDQAIHAFERLAANSHDRTDVLNMLIRLYQQQKDYKSMIQTIERVEQIEGPGEEITLSKMRVYELMGDKKSAWRSLKSLSDEHPSDLNYKVMMGNWLMQNGKQKQALKIFTGALKEEPDNSYAQSSLYDYYSQTGQDSLARVIRDRILISRKTPEQSRLAMMQQAIRKNEQQGGDSTEILQLFDRMMAADSTNADLAQLKAAYMAVKKMPEEDVNAALRHVLDIAPDNAASRLQLIQNLWPEGDATKQPASRWDSIIAVAKPATQYNPDEMVFYYFEGMAYYMKDDEDNALDIFRRGVGEINAESDKDIVSDFYAAMGDILYKKGETAQAFAAYDSCLQWKDDNISALNNYAYFLSECDSSLSRAETMSYKTIKAEPDNPIYLDTYAWILFKQKRYEEAWAYEEQALQNDSGITGSKGVYLEHAGDILSLLGKADEAVDYWQKAVQQGADNALLPKKIELRKYIAK